MIVKELYFSWEFDDIYRSRPYGFWSNTVVVQVGTIIFTLDWLFLNVMAITCIPWAFPYYAYLRAVSQPRT
ncbi:hypothetical protein F5Y09DRAFT_129264 [Xylaria sp. FL1042]|nr:hypothetical protein F5Y09DRAFT_129264 [Xylaria sp. FL1042]